MRRENMLVASSKHGAPNHYFQAGHPAALLGWRNLLQVATASGAFFVGAEVRMAAYFTGSEQSILHHVYFHVSLNPASLGLDVPHLVDGDDEDDENKHVK